MKTYEGKIAGGNELAATVTDAQAKVAKKEFDAAAAENEERNLQVELMKAEAAARRQEESERKGKETKERINEAVA